MDSAHWEAVRKTMQNFNSVFLLQGLVVRMLNEAVSRFDLVIPVELRRPYDIKTLHGVIVSDVLSFDDEELMMTCMALRLKLVDTINFFAQYGSSTGHDLGGVPDIYLRDFAPLLASYYGLCRLWMERDTAPEVIGCINSLRVAQGLYNATISYEKGGGRDAYEEYKAQNVALREQISLLLPRVHGGYHALSPEVFADLCMYMPVEMDLLVPQTVG